MKDNRSWRLVPLITFLIASSALASSPSKVNITFVHPERFTDFRAQDWSEQRTALWFANDMKAFSGQATESFRGRQAAL
jgi:hypothetical protein